MYISDIFILLIVIVFMIISFLNYREHFSLFNSIKSFPSTKVAPKYTQPYCIDNSGEPIPCPIPCQYFSESCRYDYPVPVLDPNIGAYSSNKWCPGPPIC